MFATMPNKQNLIPWEKKRLALVVLWPDLLRHMYSHIYTCSHKINKYNVLKKEYSCQSLDQCWTTQWDPVNLPVTEFLWEQSVCNDNDQLGGNSHYVMNIHIQMCVCDTLTHTHTHISSPDFSCKLFLGNIMRDSGFWSLWSQWL